MEESTEKIRDLKNENEYLRMRLAEIPDLLDKIEREIETDASLSLAYQMGAIWTLNEVRRRIL